MNTAQTTTAVGLKSLNAKSEKLSSNLSQLIDIVNEQKEKKDELDAKMLEFDTKMKEFDSKMIELDSKLKKLDELINIVMEN